MPFLQVTLEVGDADPAAAEEACFAAGALSVTLADGADEPVLEPAPGTTPLWRQVRLSALFPAGADAGVLTAVLASSLGLPAARITHEVLADRAWEREWLKDFRPMRFGRRLWICPGGQQAPDPGAAVLELDPGLAFGTGTHPTTALCLEWLDRHPPLDRSVLDYGCGSGILAIAALKLGAKSVWAVDIDEQALWATRENAVRNRVDTRLATGLPEELPEQVFDVVLANILANPLIGLAPGLGKLVRSGGDLVLSGILAAQADDVRTAYAAEFDFSAIAEREGWVRLHGVRR